MQDLYYGNNNFKPSPIIADNLFEDLFNKTQIRFVGSGLYRPYHGWDDLSEEIADTMTTVLHQPKKGDKFKEFVIEGDEWVIEELQKLPTTFAWGLSFNEAVFFLDKHGISWETIFPEYAETV